mgnify:CR=1 FL=1
MLINFFSQLWYTLSLKTLLSFQVLYSLINASISGNDFESAIKVLIQPIGWFTNRTTIRFKFQGHPFGQISGSQNATRQDILLDSIGGIFNDWITN